MGESMRYCAVFCFLVIAFPVCASDDLSNSVGFFKSTEGSVELVRNEEKISVEAGDLLQLMDVIITGIASTAAIVFEDGTRLTLDNNSELEVHKYAFVPKDEKYDFTLLLKKGTLIYSTGKLGKLAPEKVKLRTPRATVGIRGTKLLLSVQ